MPRTFPSLRALLLLAPALVLTGCQPAIGLLESLAERNNAMTAAGGRDARPESRQTPAAADGDQALAAADVTGAPVDDASDPAGEAAAPGIVYAAPVVEATSTPPPTSTPDAFSAAGNPVRIEIPAIEVDASVEAVGLTPQNAMDVPKAWMNAGWYDKGFRPGEPGNAVIAGHLDSNAGGPAVFWSLGDLAPGDEVYVTYTNGRRLLFHVEGNQVYDHDADGRIIDSIFGPSQTADLNLITCKGSWDYGNATYTERLVVFTTLVGDAPVDTAADASGQ